MAEDFFRDTGEMGVSGDKNETQKNTITAEDVKRQYIEAVSAFDTPDTRICKKCETRIRNPKLARCFYCGEMLDTERKPETVKIKNIKQEGIIMAGTLSGKYYLNSAEADGQDMMGMMEMMATTMGKSINELMSIEFPGGNKIKMILNGEEMEFEYAEDGNTVKIDFGGEEMEIIVEDNTLNVNMNGTVMVFKDTPLAEDDLEGESGTITHSLEGITVTLELPEKGWCTERDIAVWAMPTLYLYNVPSLRKKGFYTSSIEFMANENAANFDLVFDEGFKTRTEIGNRNIGGIDMTGRRWTTDLGEIEFISKNKIEHTEYIGVFGDNKGIHILISDLDIENDEVKAIIDSITFGGY